jgi:hypothetical protein
VFNQKKLTSIIELFATEQPKVYELIENSFWDEKVKRMYKQSYQERRIRPNFAVYDNKKTT